MSLNFDDIDFNSIFGAATPQPGAKELHELTVAFKGVLLLNGGSPCTIVVRAGEIAPGYGLIVRRADGSRLPDQATVQVVRLLSMYGEVAYLYDAKLGATAFRVNS